MPRRKARWNPKLHPRDSHGRFKQRKGVHHPKAPGRAKFSPKLKHVRVLRESELRARDQEIRLKLKRKKFGAPGKKISKKRVPKTPGREFKRAPKGSRKRKLITGLTTLIKARGGYAEVKGRQLYITFNSQPFSKPVTVVEARQAVPLFEERLKQFYGSRLSVISFTHTFRTKKK